MVKNSGYPFYFHYNSPILIFSKFTDHPTNRGHIDPLDEIRNNNSIQLKQKTLVTKINSNNGNILVTFRNTSI